MAKHRIGLISTSRADRNLYVPLYVALIAAGQDAYILDAGSAQQNTPDETIADSCRIMHRVGACIESTRYTMAVVLGDRPEMLAAAMACVPYRIPIVHIAGGDVTAGQPDEQYRHAISKLAHLHFVSLPTHGARLCSMGEPTASVIVTGSLSIDAMYAHVRAIQTVPNIGILCTIHPEPGLPPGLTHILSAIESCGMPVLYTAPGHGPGETAIKEAILRPRGNPNVAYAEGMGRDYYAAMRGARVMVGNSSSGITEAATFNLPVVNCGHRQDGRERDENVIDVLWESRAIAEAIKHALSREHLAVCAKVINSYGDGNAAEQMVAAIRDADFESLLEKRFRD